MPLHVPIDVLGTRIDIHIFIGNGVSEVKARGLWPFLRRMPREHVQRALVRYPIFIIRDKPGRGPGGGTWRPSEVRGAFWGRESITGVPDADLERLVLTVQKGLIGIPLNRWQRSLDLLKFTVLHEAAHSVDYEMNLSPAGATLRDFRGVRPTCGAGDLVKRHAVEAYARFILVPARICFRAPNLEACFLTRSNVFRNETGCVL
jgi:hypothetical protein